MPMLTISFIRDSLANRQFHSRGAGRGDQNVLLVLALGLSLSLQPALRNSMRCVVIYRGYVGSWASNDVFLGHVLFRLEFVPITRELVFSPQSLRLTKSEYSVRNDPS